MNLLIFLSIPLAQKGTLERILAKAATQAKTPHSLWLQQLHAVCTEVLHHCADSGAYPTHNNLHLNSDSQATINQHKSQVILYNICLYNIQSHSCTLFSRINIWPEPVVSTRDRSYRSTVSSRKLCQPVKKHFKSLFKSSPKSLLKTHFCYKAYRKLAGWWVG